MRKHCPFLLKSNHLLESYNRTHRQTDKQDYKTKGNTLLNLRSKKKLLYDVGRKCLTEY